MSCCDNMLKYIVFLFNFIFFLTGTVLIGAGAYVQIQMKNYFDFLGKSYSREQEVTSVILCSTSGVLRHQLSKLALDDVKERTLSCHKSIQI